MITILTVTLNRGNTLRKCIESVLNQSDSNFEYIVLDGLSKDNTIEIIKEYESKFFSKSIDFKWFSEVDFGIYDAMNKGIKMAKNNWIGIVNSDDYLDIEAIKILNETIAINPEVDIISGNFRSIEKNIINKANFNKKIDIYRGIIAPHVSSIIKKSLFFELGFYNIKYKIAADKDFFIKANNAKKKFLHVDEVLTNMSDLGISNLNFKRVLYENHLIRTNYGMSKYLSIIILIYQLIKIFKDKFKALF